MPLNKYLCSDCQNDFLSFQKDKCPKCSSENVDKQLPSSLNTRDITNKVGENAKYEIEMNKQRLQDLKKQKWGNKKR